MLGTCRLGKHLGRWDTDIPIKGGVWGMTDWGSREWKKKNYEACLVPREDSGNEFADCGSCLSYVSYSSSPWSRVIPALGLSHPDCKMKHWTNRTRGLVWGALPSSDTPCRWLPFCQKHRHSELWVAKIIKVFFGLPWQRAPSSRLSRLSFAT